MSQEPTKFDAPTALKIWALSGVDRVKNGDSIVAHINKGLHHSQLRLAPYDVLVVSSKVLSRSEGRFVDLNTVTPSPRAQELAHTTKKDPRLVTLILQESASVSRAKAGVLITEHKQGFVSANAAIDASNAMPTDSEDDGASWVLLLPEDPQASARALHKELEREHGGPLGLIVSDSFGRPFRYGTLGTAIAVVGLPALVDLRGKKDLDGRTLEHSATPLADALASAADLVSGQSDEGRPFVLIRGLNFEPEAGDVADLLRDKDQDLYR